MPIPFELPVLRAVTAAPDAASVDLVVALYAGEPAEAFRANLPVAARVEFDAALARGEAVSDLGRVLVASTAAGGRVVVVGAGPGPLTRDRARRAVAAAAGWARDRRCRRIAVCRTSSTTSRACRPRRRRPSSRRTSTTVT